MVSARSVPGPDAKPCGTGHMPAQSRSDVPGSAAAAPPSSAPGGQALPAPRPASPGSPGQGTPAGAAPADTGKCAEPGGVCGPGSRRHGDDEP